MLLGKEVVEKMILVLEKSLIFSQKILYEPCQTSFMCLKDPKILLFSEDHDKTGKKIIAQ